MSSSPSNIKKVYMQLETSLFMEIRIHRLLEKCYKQCSNMFTLNVQIHAAG